MIFNEKFRKQRLVENQILQTFILEWTTEPCVEGDERQTIQMLLGFTDRKIRMFHHLGEILNAGPG